MKERPIIFSGEMVRAILDGRKTQTRRAIKPQPNQWLTGHDDVWPLVHFTGIAPWFRDPVMTTRKCPYGVSGDHLWVRETWTAVDDHVGIGSISTAAQILYRADDMPRWRDIPNDRQREWYCKLTRLVNSSTSIWQSPIHMPRWASRITLEVERVRVERVQDISAIDALAEGCPAGAERLNRMTIEQLGNESSTGQAAIQWFRDLWDSINAKRSYGWDTNPWVWVVEFRRLPNAE